MSDHNHDSGCECCKGGREQFIATLERMIRRFGFAVVPTEHTTPEGRTVQMAYTVGLAAARLPELVVFGMPVDIAHAILVNAVYRLKNGSLRCSVPQSGIAGPDVYVQPVSPARTDGYLNFAASRAGGPVKGLQIVLPDTQDRFPWDAGHSKAFAATQLALFHPSSREMLEPMPAHEGGDDPVWAAERAAEVDAELLEDIHEMRASLNDNSGALRMPTFGRLH